MDGIVPLVYIGLSAGALISACLIIVSFLITAKTDNATRIQKAAFVSKWNLGLMLLISLIMLIAKETIIGYGFLVYAVPILLVLSIARLVQVKCSRPN